VGGGAPMTNLWTSSSSPVKQSALQRKSSYRGLNDIIMGQGNNILPLPNFGAAAAAENSSKRRPVPDQAMQPATKRARSEQPRIDYFPRLKVSFVLLVFFTRFTLFLNNYARIIPKWKIIFPGQN
jgi:hypothetical protein